MNEKAKALYVVDDKLNDEGLALVVGQMRSNSIFERKIMQLYWYNEECLLKYGQDNAGLSVVEFLRQYGAILYVVGEFLNIKANSK